MHDLPLVPVLSGIRRFSESSITTGSPPKASAEAMSPTPVTDEFRSVSLEN